MKYYYPTSLGDSNARRARVLSTSSLFCSFLLAFASSTLLFAQEQAWNPAQSDQWVATDGLGRALPTYEDVGAVRPDKFVACFYFLWNGRHGEAGPYDISKILKEHPEAKDDPNAPYWGGMGVPHHWGESIFGYYVGEDKGVLRKHAQMLADAGVDVVCFDVTNQLTYPESYRPLFEVFSEMQKEGNKVPKVAFLCPFWAPNKVVRELWRECYSKNFYPDVWFNWKGKPLILADPELLGDSANVDHTGCQAVELDERGATQEFRVEKSFKKIALELPTWQEKNSRVDVTLFDASGNTLEERRDVAVADCVPFAVIFDKNYEPGTYSLKIAKSGKGKVGWWSRTLEGKDYEKEANQARPIKDVSWLGATREGKSENVLRILSVGAFDEELEQILEFFTFRPSQPDYFMGQTKVNQWSWLEAYPQHGFYNDKGELEEMGVGVAQNAVDGKLGVLSNPRSYGRSFHNGAEPASEDCDYSGKNFQEQWERALDADPQILFVTGWNEWIAGRFDINAPFHGATPVSFVDQYNEEFSRDCEPMKGGHADAYYYQLIANIRRFKGVSKPEPTKTSPICVDGKFEDWNDVAPKFYDTINDQTRRDCRGWGEGTRYVNNTGRNDIVGAAVSYDDENVYFYVKTKKPIIGAPSCENWFALLLDLDEDAKNDYIVESSANGERLALKKVGDDEEKAVCYKTSGGELELAIPRDALNGIDAKPTFRFKWIDGIDPRGDWSAFTTDGDAAPNDRYYYRYDAR